MGRRNLLRSSEKGIQTLIIQWLRYHGYYVMRLNSGKFAIGEGAARRFVSGQDAGTPDVLALKAAQPPTFIEVKRDKYNKPTPIQLAKMEELERYGARCFVATSLEDVERELGGEAA